MATICFYFQIHQPYRIRPYRVFDIGEQHDYYSHTAEGNLNNQFILNKVAENCYLPMGSLLMKLLDKYPEFSISFSVTGVALEQLERNKPEVIGVLKDLSATGRADFLAETYYHSLASVYDQSEFRDQVTQHRQKLVDLLDHRPRSLRNTELIYSNAIAEIAHELGFTTVLTEGVDEILGRHKPNYLFTDPSSRVTLLLKNYKLSDDIAFRYSDKNWNGWPLTVEKYVDWISDQEGDVINLFMDMETFGEHHKADTGIFVFFEELIESLRNRGHDFAMVSELKDRYKPVDKLHIPHHISWADSERDLSAWTENSMQLSATQSAYELLPVVRNTNDTTLMDDFRKLLSSDHVYYMSTKLFGDGDVHNYFSPYETPYEAFTNFMNVLHDIRYRVELLSKTK